MCYDNWYRKFHIHSTRHMKEGTKTIFFLSKNKAAYAYTHINTHFQQFMTTGNCLYLIIFDLFTIAINWILLIPIPLNSFLNICHINEYIEYRTHLGADKKQEKKSGRVEEDRREGGYVKEFLVEQEKLKLELLPV